MPKDRFHVIIPAAGAGLRLRPHTHTAPKPLLPVAGQPILGHILDRLVGLPGLGRVVIVVGFLGDQIEDYVRTHYRFDVSFVHQDELRGLGFAVHLALAEIPDDPALIILGDTIVDVDLAGFLSGTDDLLGVQEVDDPRRFGVVELRDGLVRRLVEKPVDPPSRLAVVGVYGIRSTALLRRCLGEVVERGEGAQGEIQITDALQMMVERGCRLRAWPVDGWYDCGKVETLLLTNRLLLAKRPVRYDLPGAVVIPPVFIAPSAIVERSVIGPHVSVGERAVIRDAVVRNAIIADDSQVCACVLEDSIVGLRAVVQGSARRLNVGESSVLELP